MAYFYNTNHILTLHNNCDATYVTDHHTHSCRNSVTRMFLIPASTSHYDGYVLQHITHGMLKLCGHESTVHQETTWY